TQAATSGRISAADLATYKQVQAHLEAQKRAIQEAEDAGKYYLLPIVLPLTTFAQQYVLATKRKTTTRALLSDDEQAMAGELPSIRPLANGSNEEDLASDEERGSCHSGEDEDLQVELDGVDIDDVDMEPDLGSPDTDSNNEIRVETPDNSSISSSQRSRSRSVAPKTPVPKKQGQDAQNTANTSKVVEKDFSPRTLKLALAAKSHVRTRTIFDEPFPRNNKISRINFAWKTIKESAIVSDDVEVRQAYKRAMNDTGLKSKLMKFTLYGRTGLISSIISKAREKVRAYYGLSGDPDLVKRDVEWLLKSSHFVFGNINLKERTVDRMKPFGAQLIIDIIEAQWFPSTSRSKLDLETTNKIFEKRDLPLNVFLLVVTAIEHALKEWSTNGRKATQITFSEDTARLRQVDLIMHVHHTYTILVPTAMNGIYATGNFSRLR
ncbi:hypothetical protein CVT26_006286, partial [Gymnopilus dilepis]